jgi:hypothetical protein
MFTKRTYWRRVLVVLRLVALVLVAGSVALIVRSGAVAEECAWTSGRTRWTFTSTHGSLQVSRLRRFAGTVQTFVASGASGARVEQFVGAEAGFGRGGWTYSRELTVPTVMDPFVPWYTSRPAPAFRAVLPPVVGGVRWRPLEAPEAASYVTGTTVVVPYWLPALVGFMVLYRPSIRLIFRYVPTGIHLNLQP